MAFFRKGATIFFIYYIKSGFFAAGIEHTKLCNNIAFLACKFFALCFACKHFIKRAAERFGERCKGRELRISGGSGKKLVERSDRYFRAFGKSFVCKSLFLFYAFDVFEPIHRRPPEASCIFTIKIISRGKTFVKTFGIKNYILR